jgi:Protein of unknown function (DUF3455)
MSRVRAMGVTFGLAAVAAAAVACNAGKPAAGAPAGEPQPSTNTATQNAALEVAAQIKVPDGNKLMSTMEARGVQVYQCTAGAWKLLEPGATLTEDGKTVALHSRGPVWVSTVDGSAVNASAVPGATAARPNAVPEVLLKATATRGNGVFGKVTYVQRLKTEGGLAPSGACTGDSQTAAPYTAVYAFYAAA